TTGAAALVDQVRLFRNDPAIRWRYRVHEQILPAVRHSGADLRWTDVVIHHRGYLDPEIRARKRARNLRLLEMDRAEHPDDPFVWFNLGTLWAGTGKPAEALDLLRRSLAGSKPGDSITPKLHVLLSQCHSRLADMDAALAVCRAGRQLFPDDAELLFHEGLLL